MDDKNEVLPFQYFDLLRQRRLLKLTGENFFLYTLNIANPGKLA